MSNKFLAKNLSKFIFLFGILLILCSVAAVNLVNVKKVKATATPTLYVAVKNSNYVDVLDLTSHSITHKIRVDSYPQMVFLNPAHTKLWVICNGEYGNYIDVIDTSTNNVVHVMTGSDLSSGGVTYLVFSPDGSKVYINVGDKIQVVNTSTYAISHTITGTDGGNMAINSDGSKLYVLGGGEYQVITTSDDSIDTVTVDNGTNGGIALTPDDSKVYITAGTVADIYNASTDAFISSVSDFSVSTGGGNNIIFTPDGSKAYVANANSIIVINASMHAISSIIKACNNAYGLAVDNSGDHLYTSCGNSNDISVISTSSDEETGSESSPYYPQGIAYTE